MAVARFEGTSLMPILARIAVADAASAETVANIHHGIAHLDKHVQSCASKQVPPSSARRAYQRLARASLALLQ
jgi:hypothetical protein